MCRTCLSSARAIKETLELFHDASGLKANPIKSSVTFDGGNVEENKEFAAILNVSTS